MENDEEKTIVLDRETMDKLRKQAEAKGQTVAAYIHEALESYRVQAGDGEKS